MPSCLRMPRFIPRSVPDWKPQEIAWQWEHQRKGLEIRVSQKVRPSSSQWKVDGPFKTG